MIKKIESIKQISDLIDNDRTKFYGGKEKDLSSIDKGELSKMKLEELDLEIKRGIWVKIRRA